jgi:hypothetical protein
VHPHPHLLRHPALAHQRRLRRPPQRRRLLSSAWLQLQSMHCPRLPFRIRRLPRLPTPTTAVIRFYSLFRINRSKHHKFGGWAQRSIS